MFDCVLSVTAVAGTNEDGVDHVWAGDVYQGCSTREGQQGAFGMLHSVDSMWMQDVCPVCLHALVCNNGPAAMLDWFCWHARHG